MGRAIELLLMGLAALVVLLPRPTLDAEPALKAKPIELENVAALEDAHSGRPDDVEAACNLADAYLDFDHPEWTLQTLAGYLDKKVPRVHLLRAIAHADRLEVAAGLEETKRGLKLCDELGAQCSAVLRQKLELIQKPLQALIDKNVDPAKDPLAARNAVGQALRATKGLKVDAPPKK